ncbi:hypothetical protein [Ammoniphilus sp. CFH 90114]|uniref:hypothetical protein n=1 Tax=Ammoniphilus sp. CFH 90114 TaxID=2493665 RepID=UPI00100F99C9|nr:hypothetical protein [Ammoniphilus sp. CFH 90114]RXT04254.1 hypothetical protein EIZ39_20440 [Ammoniphilus sp. CFH 90114]
MEGKYAAMFWLVWIIVSLLAWWGIDQWIDSNTGFGSWWASLIMSLVGAWLGDTLLGSLFFVLGGFNVIGGLAGGVLFTWLWNKAKAKV